MSNKFDLFNDMSIDCTEYEDVILTTEDTNKIKSRLHKKIHTPKNIFKRSGIIAASLAVLLIGSHVLIPSFDVFANINSLGVKLESFFDKSPNSLDEYKIIVNQSVTDKGITLLFNEQTIDDDELVTSMSLDYSKFNRKDLGIEYTGKLAIVPTGEYKLFTDGKEIKPFGTSSAIGVNPDGTSNTLNYMDFKGVDLDKNYTAKYICNKMEVLIPNKDSIIIDGNWSFDFKLDSNDIKESLKVIPIDKNIILTAGGTNVSVHLDELRNTAISLKFKYQYDPSILPEGKGIIFRLFDENGGEIKSTGVSGHNDLFKAGYLIPEGVTKIKIVPGITDEKLAWNDIKFFYDKAIDIDLSK
jgi:hypothetical protein